MAVAIIELPNTVTDFSVGFLIKHLIDYPDSVTFKASIPAQPDLPVMLEFKNEADLKKAIEAGELRHEKSVIVREYTDPFTGKTGYNRLVLIRDNVAFLVEV